MQEVVAHECDSKAGKLFPTSFGFLLEKVFFNLQQKINEILKVKSNFQTLLADPDGNVIFELNKAEIDDAHKDKQKMFNENFKVRLAFKD